jgi:hypothetical protein
MVANDMPIGFLEVYEVVAVLVTALLRSLLADRVPSNQWCLTNMPSGDQSIIYQT